MISLGPGLTLPQDAVTATFVLYGGRGSGKTNCATVLAEELSMSGQRFVFLDPMGVAFGLAHSADGEGPGLDVLKLGGIRGHIPIDPSSGDAVADLISDENVNAVIDMCRFKSGKGWEREERLQFVNDFCRRLYTRQVENTNPIMLIVDEASRFAPESFTSGDKLAPRSRAILEQIVEEGRNFGMGVALISQRSARLAKSVSELCETMIAFRTPGKGSVAPLMDWLGENVEKSELKRIGAEFRQVERGTALVVSPTWMKFEGIAHIRKRVTFDSSATPKAGAPIKRVSGPGATVDLARYQAKMAEVMERVKADDPEELRKENVILNQRIKTLESGLYTPHVFDADEMNRIATTARQQTLIEVRQAYAPLAEAIAKLPGLFPKEEDLPAQGCVEPSEALAAIGSPWRGFGGSTMGEPR